MAIIEVKQLTKRYQMGNDFIRAVDNVSLSIDKGDFVSIVGASGSGKSTLLHLMGCVEKPDNGIIIIDGEDVSSYDIEKLTIFRRRQIGLIYQFFNLIPILNVKQNITIPYELDNRKVDQKELEELIEQIGLSHRIDHYPAQLSGGEQQRVAIGRALMMRPALILADEPTGNLDSENSKQIVELLKRANQERKQTIVMITHDMEIAQEANRIIRMSDGQIVEDIRLR